MADDFPFDHRSKVKTGAIKALLKAVSDDFQEYMHQICKNKGVDLSSYTTEIEWEIELSIYQEIKERVGASTLHYIGRKVGEEVPIAPSITTLEEVLRIGINQSYQQVHSGTQIGHYRLLSFDQQLGVARIEAYNPYPGEFDSGVIYSFARRYKGANRYNLAIKADESLPCRELGQGFRSTYIISWDSL